MEFPNSFNSPMEDVADPNIKIEGYGSGEVFTPSNTGPNANESNSPTTDAEDDKFEKSSVKPLHEDPDEDSGWMRNAKCREAPPNMFFPTDGAGVDRARRICGDCAVKAQCLDYALRYRIEHGVWGGTSERERRRILRQRRLSGS